MEWKDATKVATMSDRLFSCFFQLVESSSLIFPPSHLSSLSSLSFSLSLPSSFIPFLGRTVSHSIYITLTKYNRLYWAQ